MSVGRKPKPTALKVLAGNPGHRPLNESEAAPDELLGVPEAPAHLSKDAIEEWDRVVPLLLRCGLLTSIDVDAIAGYCQAYGRWVEAERAVAREGFVVWLPSGCPIQNPNLIAANKALEMMRRFQTEFGMTPSSRSRVAVKKKEQRKSRILEVINGKGDS